MTKASRNNCTMTAGFNPASWEAACTIWHLKRFEKGLSFFSHSEEKSTMFFQSPALLQFSLLLLKSFLSQTVTPEASVQSIQLADWGLCYPQQFYTPLYASRSLSPFLISDGTMTWGEMVGPRLLDLRFWIPRPVSRRCRAKGSVFIWDQSLELREKPDFSILCQWKWTLWIKMSPHYKAIRLLLIQCKNRTQKKIKIDWCFIK